MLIQTNDKIVKLDKEWIDLIQMAIKLEIPLEEIRSFLSGDKKQYLQLRKNE
ncbi:anti-repressor SinI [Peribacillus simplex]|uniref:anti-repressor SinI n=1 Tax=Peribacillus simplex TaxID=1478 RepID=UPI003D28828E